jgi:hypothetical protein
VLVSSSLQDEAKPVVTFGIVGTVDITKDLLGRLSKTIQLSAPPISELPGLLDLPLAENDKLPLSRTDFDALLSSASEQVDFCYQEDVEKLFRVSDVDTSILLHQFFYNAAFKCAPLDNGAEASFISFWDRNVREILEVLLPQGKSIRDSNLQTSARKLRPDYGFLMDNFCPFRGEETSLSSNTNPKSELSEKLTWVYSPAPYIFGEHNDANLTHTVVLNMPILPRLLCYWACSDSRCNLRPADFIAKAIRPRSGLCQLAIEAKSNRKPLSVDQPL